ncbi:hypothetical protein B0T16DRAFT_391669 [Cercophora newfieldiana]|uniref:Uncharacterized protein n=1 Tax=Cercophora newfieldiana TaxID=92897 RepID=A0AA39Y203_9PEZI|nr:hypothetical protein B0T16DRAFT_391669 [Cercophora newfieldiana]
MDRIRNYGENEFLNEQEFDPYIHGSLTATLRIAPSGREKLQREDIPAIKLLPAVLITEPQALHLVRIDRHPNGQLHIPKKTFLLLFQAFVWTHAGYGPDNGVVTYYLATISAFLIWSHCTTTSQTQGVIIPRISDSVNDRDGIFESYSATIAAHLELARYPWFLRYVTIVEAARWVDRTYENALRSLRGAERATAYGCWESWNPAPAEERARTQLQVQVFNLINQSEATASRQIAASTKEDSASMKVLAVMTLFFMPGTLFATLFSIPS